MGAQTTDHLAKSAGITHRQDFSALLPATTRNHNDDVVVTAPDAEFLQRELSVRRLNDIHDSLWLCGRPNPPRPLHHQVLLSRDIQITEQADLHLIWTPGRILIKPLPRWLIDTAFWNSCMDPEWKACARGLLFTYTALIAYESDFRVAKDKHLVSEEMSWDEWRELSSRIVRQHNYNEVNPRFWYGELRLSRLNTIYRLRKGFLLRGYSKVGSHVTYDDLLKDNFAALGAVLAYVVIVLTAMQVGLSTEQLSGGLFQDVSYGFTVLSIIAPLAACIIIVVVVLVMFLSNWRATKRQGERRLARMGVRSFDGETHAFREGAP